MSYFGPSQQRVAPPTRVATSDAKSMWQKAQGRTSVLLSIGQEPSKQPTAFAFRAISQTHNSSPEPEASPPKQERQASPPKPHEQGPNATPRRQGPKSEGGSLKPHEQGPNATPRRQGPKSNRGFPKPHLDNSPSDYSPRKAQDADKSPRTRLEFDGSPNSNGNHSASKGKNPKKKISHSNGVSSASKGDTSSPSNGGRPHHASNGRTPNQKRRGPKSQPQTDSEGTPTKAKGNHQKYGYP